jgi:hypothetical protein
MTQTPQEYLQTVIDTVKEVNKLDLTVIVGKIFNLGFNLGVEQGKLEAKKEYDKVKEEGK